MASSPSALPQLPTLAPPVIGGPVFTSPTVNNSPTAAGAPSQTVSNNPGAITVPGGLGTVNPTVPATGNTGSTLGNVLGSAIYGPSVTPGPTSQAIASGASSAIAASIFGPNVTFARAGAFLLGLILIGAGYFMLKSTQTIIQTGGRVARAITV